MVAPAGSSGTQASYTNSGAASSSGSAGPTGAQSSNGAVPPGLAGPQSPPAFPSNATTSSGLKTEGWYLFAAIGVSVALGNTPVGPLCFGVLTVALIYQFSLLLQGK